MTHPFDNEAIREADRVLTETLSLKAALTAAWASLESRGMVNYDWVLHNKPVAVVNIPSLPTGAKP